MTDDKPVSQNNGIIATVVKASGSLLGGLPPGFLVMMLMNMIFLGFLIWILTYELDQRLSILLRVIDECLGNAPRPVMPR